MEYSLAIDGVKVIKVPDFPLEQIQREVMATCNSFPEYRSGHTQQYVLGGFAALGNPASFHNPLVRKLREWCMAALMPEFRTVAAALPRNFRLEQMYDRMMVRTKGESPSKESWHRDEDSAATDDIKFGGWCNLDSTPQVFSCIRGTHSPAGSRGGGFAKLTKAEQKRWDKLDETKKLPKDRLKVKVEIPPGCIVLFYENIIHEVVGGKAPHTMLRLFLGWRFTTRQPCLLPETAAVIQEQGVPRLKSGQRPPMYAKLHWTNWIHKLEPWSMRQMKDRCLETVAFQSGKRKDEEHTVVYKFMPPLRQMFPERMYPSYTPTQKALFVPARRWKLLKPGRKQLRLTYRL